MLRPIIAADHIQNSDDFWRTFPNCLCLSDKGRIPVECPRFKHAGLAGQDRQIGPHQQRSAGFCLAAWTSSQKTQRSPMDYAVDELNLAEFPLAAISDRFLDGTKTDVLEDTVFDREQNRHLPRRLTLSGSDRYGLPTSKDDDVLLACIQLSRLNDFSSREVSFSRYEILRLLGWADETRNYDRVATSLRRWKGLSIFIEVRIPIRHAPS